MVAINPLAFKPETQIYQTNPVLIGRLFFELWQDVAHKCRHRDDRAFGMDFTPNDFASAECSKPYRWSESRGHGCFRCCDEFLRQGGVL